MKEHEGIPILETQADANAFLYKTPYFAFLDILGFKALVQNNSHPALVELYDKIFSAQVDKVAEGHKKYAEKQAGRLGEKYTDAGLQMINISDSILIWTQHGQPSALFELVMAVSSLLGISMIQGLPLRGCITSQVFSVTNRPNSVSVIGKGLVHAYSMENIQQWSGCMIDEGIINYFRSIEKVFFGREAPAPIERDLLVLPYDIPIKNPKTGEHTFKKSYAINWSEDFIPDDVIAETFNAHNKKDDRPGSDTPEKIKNTLDFHHHCIAERKKRAAWWEALEKSLKED